MEVNDLNSFEYILEDIEKRCRTCLSICAEFNELSNSIQVGATVLPLTELIRSCTAIQISEDDDYPQRICKSCKESAITSHLFKIQCETSEKHLEKVSEKIKLLKKLKEFENVNVIEEIVDLKSEEVICNPLEVNENQQLTKPKNSYVCNTCNQFFAKKTSLKKHLRKCNSIIPEPHEDHIYTVVRIRNNRYEENVKNRTCPTCGKVFYHRSTMLRHVRTHSEPQVSCIYCTYSPSSSNDLGKHMDLMHAQFKSFQCSRCDKSFFKKSNLRLHEMIHSGVRKYTCEICGVSFVHGGNLSVHRRLHTGEKPYTCSYCGKGFTQRSALISHEAGHANVRNHVCQECGAAFSRAGALRNHLKRHMGAKPFECSVCGRKFTFSSERKRHMLIHTGTKNFECEVCGIRCTRSTNLRVHMRIHTGEKPYVCGVCEMEFKQAQGLKTHMKTHELTVVEAN